LSHHAAYREAEALAHRNEIRRCSGRHRATTDSPHRLVFQGRRYAVERQSGQGMVEYALILVLVSIVVIVILLTMGQQIQNVFSNVVSALGA
jgi:pilus assembly protein Flp/PilA